MAVTITPLRERIGAEVRGLDLTKPIPDADFAKVRQAFYDHDVLAIRGGAFSDDDHIRFSARFGELKKLSYDAYLGDRRPEIFVVSNIKENDRYIGAHDAGMFWHSDGPFLSKPHGPSALHALEVPVGDDGRALGDTEFASTAAAYDALPDAMKKKLEGLQAVNSMLRRFELAERSGVKESSATKHSKAADQEAVHAIVRVHPVSGRKCLFVSDGYTTRIVGMPDDEGKALIKELTDHIARPEFRYSHNWQPNDLVMWDNCSAQHKATFDYAPRRRLMHRTTLVDGT